jgi:hypothetical protein
MKSAVVVALVLAAPTSALAKPLLQGSFELTKLRGKDGKDLAVADMLGGTTVWLRMAIAFDGDRVTVSTASLDNDKTFVGCEASVTIDVTWSKSGFTVPANVSANGRVTEFKKLTPSDSDDTDHHCSISFEKGSYGVVAGAAPQLKHDGGILFLAPTDETDKISWSKHVK